MGLTNSPSLDELIKCTRPSWQDTDEHKITINKSIQYLGQLPNSWQIVGASLKSIFMSLEALQKKRALKPQLRPPMARNNEAVYIHSDQRQTKY